MVCQKRKKVFRSQGHSAHLCIILFVKKRESKEPQKTQPMSSEKYKLKCNEVGPDIFCIARGRTKSIQAN